MARSSTLVFVSWLLLGISYPLYSSFLPVYLATRGANISAPDVHGVYRDNLISNCVSMGGPLIAGALLFAFLGWVVGVFCLLAVLLLWHFCSDTLKLKQEPRMWHFHQYHLLPCTFTIQPYTLYP